MSGIKEKFDLSSKLVIVSGGNGLIGKAVMEGLLEMGARAICLDLACDIKHDRLEFIEIDVTDYEKVEEIIKSIGDREHGIDGLVNMAYPRTSLYGKYDFLDSDIYDWLKNLEMHVGSYFWLSKCVGESMIKHGKKGSIINFGSTYGVVGPNFSIYENTDMKNPSVYAAIKGGIINLSRYMATYLAKYGIRVNVVSPGGVWDHQPEEFVRRYENLVPLGRMASPVDLVGVVVYLLSDASLYVTGQNIMVDGGWTAW